MVKASPFFHSRVECPICKTLNEYETVKVGAYVEHGRDTDFCPTEIEWRFAKYQEYNPLVFFTATCSNCFYSREFNNSYKEWKKDSNFKTNTLKTVKEKHLDQLAREDSVLKELGKGIDLTRFPNESAIIKLLLTIYDELLSEKQSDLDIGRWYLRIGWLFRDLGRVENPNVSFLKSMMVEIENKYSQLWQGLESLKDQSAFFHKHLEAHFESDKISSELKSQMLPFRDQFDNGLDGFNGSITGVESQLQALQQLIENYKITTLGADGSGSGRAFGSYSTFTDFLMALSKQWDGIVVSERQALVNAAKFYKKAFKSSDDIVAGNQQIQASYLIAELSRRIGANDQAREYFNSTIKYGQEFINHHRADKSQTALARKILELAIEQNRLMTNEKETGMPKLAGNNF